MKKVIVRIKQSMILEWKCIICGKQNELSWPLYNKMENIPLKCNHCGGEFAGYTILGQ